MLHITACPWCGRQNDALAGTADPADLPKPGDVSICWGCHGLALFTEDGSLRRAKVAERARLLADPEIQKALAAMNRAVTPLEAVRRTRRGRRN